jgi:hypothetical protein
MFGFATDFNQPLVQWNVSSGVYMIRMFKDATSFDQPLEDWNVSSLSFMDSMFHGAINFNQPLEQWNVSKAYTMYKMFGDAISFNQCLGSWGSKTADDVFIIDIFVNSGCPDKGSERSQYYYCSYYDGIGPDPVVGPWCKGSADGCTADGLIEPSTNAPSDAPSFFSVPSSDPSKGPSFSVNQSSEPSVTPSASIFTSSVPSDVPNISFSLITRKVCVDSEDFDCNQIEFPKLKRGKKCSQVRRGVKVSELCPSVCSRFLCDCSDSRFPFKIKGRKGKSFCSKIRASERRRLCNKKNVSGFPVKTICPITCKNQKNCLNSC